MSNPQTTSPVRSIDVAGTETVNARRYKHANARICLDERGVPVAVRRIIALSADGVRQRRQLVTADGIEALS